MTFELAAETSTSDCGIAPFGMNRKENADFLQQNIGFQ
jgi:hypothetical protein